MGPGTSPWTNAPVRSTGDGSPYIVAFIVSSIKKAAFSQLMILNYPSLLKNTPIRFTHCLLEIKPNTKQKDSVNRFESSPYFNTMTQLHTIIILLTRHPKFFGHPRAC